MVTASDGMDKQVQRAAKTTPRQGRPQGPPLLRRPALRIFEGCARPRPIDQAATAPGTVFSAASIGVDFA
jgi:hypothetical protein